MNQGNFEIAIPGWGAANPHPYFGYQTVLFSRNYIAATEGKGINFPMTQTIDGAEVDLEAVIVASAEGLDLEAQKANVVTIAKAFNQLLPVIPLWERYGNSPLSDTRVTGAPDDSDKIWKNALYGDNPIVMMILDGTIHPK